MSIFYEHEPRTILAIGPREGVALPWNTTPPRTCEHCRWWVHLDGDWGKCPMPKEINTPVYIPGRDMETRADFGCNQWQAKQPKGGDNGDEA